MSINGVSTYDVSLCDLFMHSESMYNVSMYGEYGAARVTVEGTSIGCDAVKGRRAGYHRCNSS